MEVTTAVVLTFAAILVSIPNVAARSLTYDLSYSLPVVFVFVALVVIIAIIVCVMYRARQGYFCCLSPRPIYRVRQNNVEDGRNGTQATATSAQNGSTTTAPDYRTVPANANIAPPDYRDALHDVIVPEEQQQAPPEYSQPGVTSDDQTVAAGETTQPQNMELNDDSTESYDDTTPLNP